MTIGSASFDMDGGDTACFGLTSVVEFTLETTGRQRCAEAMQLLFYFEVSTLGLAICKTSSATRISVRRKPIVGIAPIPRRRLFNR